MHLVILFIILLVLIFANIHLKLRSSRYICARLSKTSFVTSNNYIFIIPQWGLGNRLRTLSGAFAAAQKLDAELVVIWKPSDHFPQHINEIYENITYAPEIPDYLHVNEIGHSGECELRQTPLQTIKDKLPCFIESCMCEINETDNERYSFYEYAKPSLFITNELKKYCKNFMSDKTIGIHLRQGDIADARDNHFFGQWTKQKDKLVIEKSSDLPCCNKDLMDQPGCPSNIQTIDERLESVEANPDHNYWIATDRIQCLPIFKEKLSPSKVRHIGCFGKIPDLDSRDMRLALIDMYMLALCTLFHGTAISSFSQEIDVIKRGVNKQLFLTN